MLTGLSWLALSEEVDAPATRLYTFSTNTIATIAFGVVLARGVGSGEEGFAVGLLLERSLQQLQGTGSETPEILFPDHDCIRGHPEGRPPLLDWAAWREKLEDRSRTDGWLERSYHEINTITSARAAALDECPVGVMMGDVLQALFCYQSRLASAGDDLSDCYATFEPLARDAFVRLGFRVLIGTRWPVLVALNSDVWFKEGSGVDALSGHKGFGSGLECRNRNILNWPAFRRLFGQAEWYQQAVDFAYGPELERHWKNASEECPLGFAVANIIKAMLCSHTESICFRSHAVLLGYLIGQVPLDHIARSGWPVFQMVSHVARAVRRHRFQLDFHPREIMGWPYSLPLSLAMSDLLEALQTATKIAEANSDTRGGLRLAYATMAYGQRFSPYVGRFVSRACALGLTGVLFVFCLDERSYRECLTANAHCIRGTPSILNKFTLPLMMLQHGLDTVWLDLDVFLFKSPTPSIVAQVIENDFDLMVQGSFAVDCVCSGIVFFRAVPRTRTWLLRLLSWMYEHPYEHDQKAFSAFLRAGERVAFDWDLPVSAAETPRWGFLDPETEFISARHVDVAGWTGDPDRIIAFHLLHGDSDDTAASNQFAQHNSLGTGYFPLLDLFFNQTGIPHLYDTDVRPHLVSQELRAALWRSRWPTPRPRMPGRCNETVPMRY